MPNGNQEKTASAPRRAAKTLAKFSIVTLLAYALGILAAAGLLWGFLQFTDTPDEQPNIAENCQTNPNLERKQLSANGVEVEAEVAESGGDQQLGLGNRNCIADDHAMMFPYAASGNYCYWMKDMNFPIDIIWLDEEKKIVTVKADISPDTYPQTFCPEGPAQYVVEVRAGKAKDAGWKPGSQFSF